MRIEYHPAAADELEESRNYYEEKSAGLGKSFVNDEFEKQILRIAAMPGRWMRVRDDLRRALMKRFPYVIYFRDMGGNGIRVTIIKHERRHPSFGLGRR